MSEDNDAQRAPGLTVAGTPPEQERYTTGDEVSGEFRCDECDLLIKSPRENDGILVLPICTLCGSERWRRVG
jgi:hypothetical protein